MTADLIRAPGAIRVFDLPAGRHRRDDGMAHAGDGVNLVEASAWKEAAAAAMDTLIAAVQVFSADDLVAICGAPPVPNMLGPLFMAARKQGRIVPVSYRQGTRPSAHGRVQRTWIKNLQERA